MQQIMWAFLASSVAIANEFLYRTISHPWHTYLWYWIPAQLVVGYSIYKLVTSSDSLISATIFFALTSTVLRMGVAIYLGDKISTATWVAFSLVAIAPLIKLCDELW